MATSLKRGYERALTVNASQTSQAAAEIAVATGQPKRRPVKANTISEPTNASIRSRVGGSTVAEVTSWCRDVPSSQGHDLRSQAARLD